MSGTGEPRSQQAKVSAYGASDLDHEIDRSGSRV